jgi:hypothetical protein
MTRQEVVDKARDLIAPVLGAAQTGKLIDAVLGNGAAAAIPRPATASSPTPR